MHIEPGHPIFVIGKFIVDDPEGGTDLFLDKNHRCDQCGNILLNETAQQPKRRERRSTSVDWEQLVALLRCRHKRSDEDEELLAPATET